MMTTYLPVIGRHAVVAPMPGGAVRVLCPPEAAVFAVLDGAIVAGVAGGSYTLRAANDAVTVYYEGIVVDHEHGDGRLVAAGSIIGRAANPPMAGGGIVIRTDSAAQQTPATLDLLCSSLDPLGADRPAESQAIGRASSSTAVALVRLPTPARRSPRPSPPPAAPTLNVPEPIGQLQPAAGSAEPEVATSDAMAEPEPEAPPQPVGRPRPRTGHPGADPVPLDAPDEKPADIDETAPAEQDPESPVVPADDPGHRLAGGGGRPRPVRRRR